MTPIQSLTLQATDRDLFRDGRLEARQTLHRYHSQRAAQLQSLSDSYARFANTIRDQYQSLYGCVAECALDFDYCNGRCAFIRNADEADRLTVMAADNMVEDLKQHIDLLLTKKERLERIIRLTESKRLPLPGTWRAEYPVWSADRLLWRLVETGTEEITLQEAVRTFGIGAIPFLNKLVAVGNLQRFDHGRAFRMVYAQQEAA